MRTKVELINNPYIQRLRILINGEAVSVYSNLEKYMDEPFSYWCDKILDSIYEECNGEDFNLHFCSRKEETVIMEKLAKDYAHCTQYSSGSLMRPTPLLERIKELNNIVKSVRNSGYHTFKNEVLFVIPDSLKRLESDLLGLEVENSFCKIVPKVAFIEDYGRKNYDADTVFLLGDAEMIKKYLQSVKRVKGFAIELGGRKAFKEKLENVFVYESTQEALFETIFECLLLSPLLDMFCSCIKELSSEIKEKYSEKIEKLQSIELKIIPVPESTTIEAGRSSRIKFTTDINGYDVKIAQLHYSYSNNGIIHCNGLLVEGLKEGKAILHIYKEGEQIPCANVEYTVIKRKRIEKLMLEDDTIVIGEGDYLKLNLSYLPADADNAELIEWESDNVEVAKVDNFGNLQGVSKGNCTIRCYAEQVGTSCQCIVKPHLKSISPDANEINLIYGQEKELKINLKPENCIDDQIIFSSMDMQIVNVVGRTLKAVGIGTTRVIIQNKQESVKTEIEVHVMKETKYKKSGNKDRKGLLSKLFG